MAVHTQAEKRHVCDICGREYVQARNLSQHLKTHRPDEKKASEEGEVVEISATDDS